MVKLEQIRVKDAEKLFRISNEETIRKYNFEMYFGSCYQAKKFIRERIKIKETKLFHKILNDDGIMIGVIIATEIGTDITFSYIIDKNFRNKGYGTNTLLVAENIIRKENYTRIFLAIDSKNFASIKAAKKNGFEKEKDFSKGYTMFEKVLN